MTFEVAKAKEIGSDRSNFAVNRAMHRSLPIPALFHFATKELVIYTAKVRLKGKYPCFSSRPKKSSKNLKKFTEIEQYVIHRSISICKFKFN